MPSSLTTRALPALCLALAACNDVLLTPPAGTDAEPAATVTCTVITRPVSVSCGGGSAPVAANLIVGGQNVYVRLASSGTVYDSASGILQSSVTVQNLLDRPMGTTDGTTVQGVEVFFHSGPTAVVGSGIVSVANADGVGVFTAAGQPYFHYDGLLPPGAVSQPRIWRFAVPPTVRQFVFELYVQTRLPFESDVLWWVADSICACDLLDLWHPGGDTVVAVGRQNGAGLVMYSRDAGATWQAAVAPFPIASILHVSGSGSQLFAVGWQPDRVEGQRIHRLYRDIPGATRLLRSGDGGESWEIVPTDPDFEAKTIWASGSDVFVVGWGCGDYYDGYCWSEPSLLLRSADGLRSFQIVDIPQDWLDEPMVGPIWASGPHDLYVSSTRNDHGVGLIFRSTDRGDHWTEVYTDIPSAGASWMVQITGTDAGHVYAIVRRSEHYTSRVVTSTDGGATWTAYPLPDLMYTQMWAASPVELFVLGQHDVLGGPFDSRGLFRFDGTQWWNLPPTLPPVRSITGTSSRNVFLLLQGGKVLHGIR